MIDFWIFPLSTIWGAYQNAGFAGNVDNVDKVDKLSVSVLRKPGKGVIDCRFLTLTAGDSI